MSTEPLERAATPNAIDDAYIRIACKKRKERDNLEAEADRLREYVQRDIDCEEKECPVQYCLDCHYYNTYKMAKYALPATKQHV